MGTLILEFFDINGIIYSPAKNLLFCRVSKIGTGNLDDCQDVKHLHMGHFQKRTVEIFMGLLGLVGLMWVKQCHKPTMTGSGNHSTQKMRFGGIVYEIGLPTWV